MLFPFNEDGVVDVGEWNTDKNDSPTVMIGKVNAFTRTPSADTVKDSPFGGMLLELFNVVLTAPFFKDLGFDLIHFGPIVSLTDTITQFAEDFEVRADDKHSVRDEFAEFEDGVDELIVYFGGVLLHRLKAEVEGAARQILLEDVESHLILGDHVIIHELYRKVNV